MLHGKIAGRRNSYTGQIYGMGIAIPRGRDQYGSAFGMLLFASDTLIRVEELTEGGCKGRAGIRCASASRLRGNGAVPSTSPAGRSLGRDIRRGTSSVLSGDILGLIEQRTKG